MVVVLQETNERQYVTANPMRDITPTYLHTYLHLHTLGDAYTRNTFTRQGQTHTPRTHLHTRDIPTHQGHTYTPGTYLHTRGTLTYQKHTHTGTHLHTRNTPTHQGHTYTPGTHLHTRYLPTHQGHTYIPETHPHRDTPTHQGHIYMSGTHPHTRHSPTHTDTLTHRGHTYAPETQQHAHTGTHDTPGTHLNPMIPMSYDPGIHTRDIPTHQRHLHHMITSMVAMLSKVCFILADVSQYAKAQAPYNGRCKEHSILVYTNLCTPKSLMT